VSRTVNRRRGTRSGSSRAAYSHLTALLYTWAEAGQSAIHVASAGRPDLESWCHYPGEDVRDASTQLRFYYHCHPQSGSLPGEHGHFHVFVDSGGPRSRECSHLVAIALDAYGLPVRFFTVNRWVTGERWLSALDLERRLASLPSSAEPALPIEPQEQLVLFVRALLRYFRPQLFAVLASRDARTMGWRDADFENRRRYRLSECPISLFDSTSPAAQHAA
jgi:hypothetical protein